MSGVVIALAAAALATALLWTWRERRRRRAPELAVLCMDFARTRRARFQICTDHPAASSDWSIRRVEWLAPEGVVIAAGPDGPVADRAVETDLAPRDADGRWFAGDPTLWARYGKDSMPAHEVKLRVTLELPGGRRQRLVIGAVFPAMDWRIQPRRPAGDPPRLRSAVDADLMRA